MIRINNLTISGDYSDLEEYQAPTPTPTPKHESNRKPEDYDPEEEKAGGFVRYTSNDPSVPDFVEYPEKTFDELSTEDRNYLYDLVEGVVFHAENDVEDLADEKDREDWIYEFGTAKAVAERHPGLDGEPVFFGMTPQGIPTPSSRRDRRPGHLCDSIEYSMEEQEGGTDSTSHD